MNTKRQQHPGSNDDDEIDHVSEISRYEPSDNAIL